MKNVKIGDKVVLISEDHWSKSDYLKVGEIYTVDRLDDATIKVSEGRHYYYISKSQFKRVVTTVDIGAKVVRGKDWAWSDQDAGSCYGIITEKDSSTNWVAIDWISDTGRVITGGYQYRIGDLNKYDLYYYDGPEVITTEPVSVPPIVAKPEPLILGKYKIGDVVVSLAEYNPVRRIGDMFVVLPKSSRSNLYYRDDRNGADPSSWRAATEFEAASFRTGTRNIKDIVSSATSSSVVTPAHSFESLRGKYVKCITDSSNDYTEGKYYYVHKHDKDSITIVDRAGSFRWMLDKSHNIVNNVYDLSKGYNWVTSYELDHDAFKHVVGKTIPKSELPFDVPVTAGSDTLDQIGKPYKPDASFQVAFVDTQLRKPGKKQKIKF
jgi:hypothetical protein